MGKNKLARIIYDEKFYGEGQPCFVLQTWSEKHNSWSIETVAPCHKSVSFPDEETSSYVHGNLLKDIARLSAQGYTVTYGIED